MNDNIILGTPHITARIPHLFFALLIFQSPAFSYLALIGETGGLANSFPALKPARYSQK